MYFQQSTYELLTKIIPSLKKMENSATQIIIPSTSFRIRKLDLVNLSTEDRDVIAFTGNNFGGMQSMFGTGIAIPLKCMSWLSFYKILDMYIKYYTEKALKTPEQNRVDLHFIIEDLGIFPDRAAPIAMLSFSNYIDEIPENYDGNKNKLVEVGIMMAENYRRKGLATKFGQSILNLIRLHLPPYSRLCFVTRPDNVAMHSLAAKIPARFIGQISKKIDFGLFTKTVMGDFFTIDAPNTYICEPVP
ncbi:Hypothetical protein HVR_LOCUS491 [uncultured virus]|nr:Hypothetical protein HVR_LOCUS491 [uncultured virus]